MKREKLRILYEDQNYLALDKPAGLSSGPTIDQTRDSLLTLAQQQFSASRSLSLAHRLDVETSGALLLAKNKPARQALDFLFKQHLIKKTYVGLAYYDQNTLAQNSEGKWCDYLKEKTDKKISYMQIVSSGGEVAITNYRMLRQGQGICLMQFGPESGRKHQIRCQAAYHGFPLVGDELYGPFKKDQGIETFRHWLHAETVEFDDPVSNQKIKIYSPMTQDFIKLLEKGLCKRYLLLNKPFNMLSQFSGDPKELTLADIKNPDLLPSEVWPVGRLDKKSEGFLILTDDQKWRHFVMSPESGKTKIYWAQVDGSPNEKSIQILSRGLLINGHKTRPCQARKLAESEIETILARNWPVGAPVRVRKNIPTTWLEIILQEGKNHQVRHMTAAIGHPTLRLIRIGYGKFRAPSLVSSAWRALSAHELNLIVSQ